MKSHVREGYSAEFWSLAVADDERQSYEQELTTFENHEDNNRMTLYGTAFRKISGSPEGSDGYVWIQEDLPPGTHYDVRRMYNNEETIAIFSHKGDAVSAARYAASHDGGYGDVCIITTNLPVTHISCEDWIFG
ncbi:hypothetical protein [Superficieibacter sp. 1612_C1]|jgi:hypothetical protein|uniref:hypothetical protein n=1 Tax=Superficieibacter sp. 1612_C1 TaxID=2780382 RepID=UPI001883B1ED|nr:hypothetical protein [Superficieibacter sp. 1612_C1]